jgi:putative transcriptional regulator
MSDVLGKLLIAPPKMLDWRFAKAVIYMWKHDVSGAGGVIINKRIDNPTFQMVCRDGKIFQNPKVNPLIYYGGPILTNLIGCLHSTDYKIITTNPEQNSVGFTLDKKILEDIAQNKGPKNYVITMGMASWMPGQLESEIDGALPRLPGTSWLVLDYDPQLVFGAKTKDFWEKCVQRSIEKISKKIVDKAFSTLHKN